MEVAEKSVINYIITFNFKRRLKYQGGIDGRGKV
jgi:hypothetical protein